MEKRLQEILKVALKYHVTDIHFSLTEKDDPEVIIEMRVDGVIQQMKPGKDDVRLFHYLMYRANLDITSSFVPQTGSFQIEIDNTWISARFALVNSFQRTSGVLRILNGGGGLQIDQLSYDKQVTKYFQTLLQHRTGLFVFSGPTCSGKTTTLYTLLNACKGKKIYTLEDPIEVISDKYIQLQVNEKQHLSYADGIKQLMRHDPDIVMIGEIRDSEAARMAVRCALTGHLVVTTLHASDCTGAIHRLLDLGADRYQLMDVLLGISNQRLYSAPHHLKTGVYECMNRKEVEYWFTHHQLPYEHISLQEKIRKAVERNEISYSEACSDLVE